MIAAVVQARMGSTRLAGKTLASIEGRPLLEHVVNRARGSRFIQRVVVATTQAPEDRAIVEWAAQAGVEVSLGSELDVLDRMYHAARAVDASVVVRITADDPFKDPVVIDRILDEFLSRSPRLDYASNTITPTYPEGLDIEVIAFRALERAWHDAALTSEREHVTPYIWKHPELFSIANIAYERDLSKMRWTIDYEEDLAFAREVYRRLYAANPLFGLAEILSLLDREPEIGRINSDAGRVRNEGYYRSVATDQAHTGSSEAR